MSHNYYCKTDTTEPLEVDESIQYAVVMLFEMSQDTLETTPEFPASIETGFAYSRMAFTAATVGQVIRSLGYRAIPAGNDTALSIPLAVDAISFEKMTSEGPYFSNNPGVMKWHLNAERCYRFWSENGLDCSTCIISCPFSSRGLEDHHP